MSPTRQQIARAVKVFGTLLFLAVFTLVLGGYLERGTTNSRLTSILSRRSPVTDYYIATTETKACRSAVEDRFHAHTAAFQVHIADALISSGVRTPEETALLRDQVALDRALIETDKAQLAQVEVLCPYPAPPTFDDKGNIVSPPGTGPSIPPPVAPDTEPVPTK